MDVKTRIAVLEILLKIGIAIAGGVWAVFLLNHLKKRAKSEAEVEKLRQELITEDLKAKEIEIRIRKQVSVSVAMTLDMPHTHQGYLLIVTVCMTNHGNEATRIKWKDEPPALTVRHVSFEGGKPRCGALLEFRVMSTANPETEARAHVVRAGATETLVFAVQLEQPGLYLLSFRAATSCEVRTEAEQYGVRLPTAWTAKRYVSLGAPEPVVRDG